MIEGQEVNTHPDAPERAAAAKRGSQCQPCKRRGAFQVAHRRLPNGDGICNPCFRVGRDKEDAADKRIYAGDHDAAGESPASTRQRPKDEEGVMAKERQCGERGCEKRLIASNRSGYCTKHFYRSKQKASGGGRRTAASGRQEAGGSVKPNGAAAAGVSEAALDGWWASLADEVKEEAFNLVMTKS